MNIVRVDILDSFLLQDGTRVFTGLLDPSIQRVGVCRGVLLVDGEFRQAFNVDGEIMVEGVVSGSYRGFSTREIVSVTREEVIEKSCILELETA